MSGPFRSLHFAVRLRVLAHYLGQILLPLAWLTLVPASVSAWSGQLDVTLLYAAVIAALGSFGWLASRLHCPERIQTNEALAITALVFGISALALSLPLTGYGISFLDALFESFSGVTTTGLSTLGSVEERPRAFLFARAWMQWLGGLGVAVLALAFLIRSSVAARRLGFDERELGDVVSSTRAHAKRVLAIYVALSAAGVALCWLCGLAPFDALVHTLAAVSTGGFAPRDASLADLPRPAVAAISLLSVAGAISFAWYRNLRWRRLTRAFRDPQLLSLGVFLVSGALLLLAVQKIGGSPWHRDDAVWMAISAQTTAGFSSAPVAGMDAASKLVLILLMLIGGELGSTAGGIKLMRFLVLLRLLAHLVQRASLPPSAELPLRIGRFRVRPEEIQAVGGLALAYLAVVGLSWLVFLGYGHDPLDSLFDVVSAVGTVGLSAGVVGPELQPVLKGVLCLDMWMGRVELIGVFVLLFPATWIGRRRSSR